MNGKKDATETADTVVSLIVCLALSVYNKLLFWIRDLIFDV